MIIKFRENDIWHVFDEVDSLSYETEEMGPSKNLRECGTLEDYASGPCKEEDAKSGTVILWMMHKDQEEQGWFVNEIRARRPVFLLNNSGQTIDKI